MEIWIIECSKAEKGQVSTITVLAKSDEDAFDIAENYFKRDQYPLKSYKVDTSTNKVLDISRV
jgi:hypothetical protein